MSALKTQSLEFTYREGTNFSFPDLHLQNGEHCLLLGKSGSGKTTWLHLLGGLLKSHQGSIDIEGMEIGSLKDHKLDLFRGKNIGFIFQKHHLLSSLTVWQNLLLSGYLSQSEHDRDLMDELLESLDVSQCKHTRVNRLSAGQAQRVAIARAMMNKPKLVLADEPTSALDDENCSRVIELLKHCASKFNSTLIIATHDQRLRRAISTHVDL